MTTDMIANIGFAIAAIAFIASVFVLIIWAFGDQTPKDGDSN